MGSLFSDKYQLKQCPYKRLNEEQLCKECEREVEAHEFQPIRKKRDNTEPCIIRVI